MSNLSGKHVLLIIGGGIAAYKTLDLIRRLRERNASITTVLTKAAKQFVTPLSVASLSGHKVFDELFSLTDETEIGHIQLSRASDLVVVAPATADLMAKAALGLADDLASTLLLATDKTPIFVPAMNVRMWAHHATQRNIATLTAAGCSVLGPADGEMACGEFGPGRMIEPLDIVARLEELVARGADAPTAITGAQARKPLAGRHAVVTAGPTREAIDPVRYISNKSSGKQGYAIAAALTAAGAETVLVSGPVDLAPPAGVTVKHAESARDMLAQVQNALPTDIFVAAAAVADWRVGNAGTQKTKKGPSGPPTIELVENPDILRTISQMTAGRPKLVVGFAAETENLVANAQAKLARKNCDLIIANDVGAEQAIFGGDLNRVVIVDKSGAQAWPQANKAEIADRIVALIATRLDGKI
ncbi:MAG: bifunctional phosphopantothenoylcysteine decarboxylase/phosphopantothenate--cysteine ligase CoaBC [Rhodoblastus sp.]